MKKKKISLSLFFMSSVIIAFIITGGLALSIVKGRLTDENIADVYKTNNEIALSSKYKIESTLNEQISIIKGVEIAHHGLISAGDVLSTDYYELILDQNEYLVSLEIINLDNIIVYSSRTSENREGVSVEGNQLLSHITGIHQQHIGGLVYDTTSESLTLEILYSGEDVNILGRISIDYLTDFGDNFKTSFEDKEIIILNTNGVYIFDSANSNHLIQNRYNEIDELLSDAENNVSVRKMFDNQAVFSVTEVNEGWYIVIFENVETGLRLSRLNLNYFILSMLAITVLMSIIFLAYDFIVLRSLKTLSKSFSLVKDKQFQLVEDISMFKEIDDLKSNYNNMVTEIDFYINRLQDIAYYDYLTGNPTKQKAREDFDKNVNNYNRATAFMYIDIVRFSLINDNYGYDIGDESLKQVASLLSKEFEIVYRIEGDEFLVVVDIPSIDKLEELINRLQISLENNINIFGNKYNLKLKYGISMFKKDGNTFEELLKKAVIASESVRSKLIGNYEFYDDSKTTFYERTSKIELIVGEALAGGEFYTVYQPIVDAKTLNIRGFEALSRWKNKDLSQVTPDEFIPILERTRQIHKLDQIVLHNALRLSKFLLDEYDIRLVASVNISVETIMRDNFEEMVELAIQKFNMDPHLLELEITESTIITDFKKITKKMTYLRNLGVKFSEDDFGDRYSSLTYLSRLKIDTLKISKSFLSTMLSNVESRVLVQTILGLSQRLGFFTIVEGVEDERIFDLFKKYGCDYVQGYYFYKPMLEEKIIDLFKDNIREE